MKYGIWRHENALGNSAEQVVNLNDFIIKQGDKEPVIYVETEFQKDFALCIQGVKEENIIFFDKNELNLDKLARETNPILNEIYLPNVYFGHKELNYPSVWGDLKNISNDLVFPENYENKHNLPKGAIVMSIREAGTYWKRVDGANSEPSRFVDPKTFFDVATHFANKGYTVVRIGDPKQSPMPEHENILDFSKVDDRRMLDDLFLINHSKVFLSCDSGVWPMAGGLRAPLILSNVTSVFSATPPKYSIVNWLPEESSVVLFKENKTIDNTFNQLVENIEKFL
jgi:putative glycosyltransferase (TIGR04372 family)